MADQDFNIKVVTTADTTGLKQTSVELDKLKQQQAMFAETARRQAAATAAAKPPPTENLSFSGSAVGVGSIIALLTGAISKWKEFNAEQDRWVEGMIKSQEKSRELGLSVVDMLDAMKSAERIETEPLQISFDRLKQKVIELKTEMKLAFDVGEYEDVKKYAAALGVVESQLRGVTSAMAQEAAAADKAKKALQSELEKRVPGLGAKPEIQEADAQTQRILQNEQAAATARAQGREKDAEMFEKSAERYKKSATPAQLADLQRIHDLQDKLKPPAPVTPTHQPEPGEPGGGEVGTGEAKLTREEMRQRQLDARAARYKSIQQTRKESEEADDQLKKTNEELRKQGQKPITKEESSRIELKVAIEDLGRKFDRYWG